MFLAFLLSSLTPLAAAQSASVNLVTFDGADSTTFPWTLVNDPVMGGLSRSTYTIDKVDELCRWNGTVEIVPSLQAPGFCNLENPGFHRFNDASPYSHLIIRMNSKVDYKGWKVSFAADTLNPQFASFKADFEVAGDGQWHDVALPWNSFSNKWSPSTGEPTVPCSPDHPEVCPTLKNLKDISSIGFWTEGVQGAFDAQIAWVRAGNVTNASSRPLASPSSSSSSKQTNVQGDWTSVCTGPIQKGLRYNMGNRTSSYLPGEPPADETMGDAICCDPNYAVFAEPPQFFARPDVAMFLKVNITGLTTFYDSVCGIPLFVAPQNRTFQEWRDETKEHGWPSFRPAEMVPGNVKIMPNGDVFSSCGTKLGTNLPDGQDRYCLDLVCISGNPQ